MQPCSELIQQCQMVDIKLLENIVSGFSTMDDRISLRKRDIKELEKVTYYELEHFIGGPSRTIMELKGCVKISKRK